MDSGLIGYKDTGRLGGFIISPYGVGHISSRVQTVRYAGQYPVQEGPIYVYPNSQAVMVGRFGQLVYVHPVSQDLVQGTPAISPLPARPMLTPHQVQWPKHQGQALPLCAPPQFMATGQQPFPIAKSHPIFTSSFPSNCRIRGLDSNGTCSPKFW